MRVVAWLRMLGAWRWILGELWRLLKEDGCVEEVSGFGICGGGKGCLKGYGGWKDRCEYRGGRWK